MHPQLAMNSSVSNTLDQMLLHINRYKNYMWHRKNIETHIYTSYEEHEVIYIYFALAFLDWHATSTLLRPCRALVCVLCMWGILSSWLPWNRRVGAIQFSLQTPSSTTAIYQEKMIPLVDSWANVENSFLIWARKLKLELKPPSSACAAIGISIRYNLCKMLC